MLHTDHLALKQLNAATTINQMHALWIEYLQCFTFVIHHKVGKQNKVADTLRRHLATLTIL